MHLCRVLRRPLVAAMSLLPLLAGCTVGPDFLRPQHSSGNAYAAREGDGGTEKPLESQQRFVMGEKLTGSWWQLFRSPELNQLIEHAIAGNRNLAAARATMAQARELVDQAGGARYPQFSLGGDGRRSHSNYAASGFDQSGPTSNLFGVGPNLSYALDLFGGLARQEERQGALADFQEHQLSAAYLTLTGNSVAQAIQSASIAAQIKTVEEIVRQDEQNLESVRKLFRVQEATKIDVQSAESQVATSRTLLPPLRQQLSASRHALAVLVGKAAHDWTPPQFELDRFTLPAELPASLPSELLRQRPDVLAAEAQLHAASAGVGVATAQLYPNITLSASMAQQALSPTALFGAAANIWSLASNLTAPIFNGGALMAQKRAAEDAFQASLANYEQTVLTSFSQVADLMDALVHDAELVEAQRRAVESSRASVRLTRDSFAAGEARLIQVLDAERLYGQARLGYVRAVAQRYVDTSQFFIAMGGGWWDWKERTAALPPR